MNEKDFEELAAGAALHSLSADDDRRYRAALAEHPEWRAIVDSDTATAATLADSVEPVAAPAFIRSALLARITDMPQDGGAGTDPGASDAEPRLESAPETESRFELKKPRRWTRTIFALAACLALLVGVGVGAIALNQQLNPPESVVALQEIEAAGDAQQATVELDGGGTATAHWSGSAGKAVLVADGLPSAGDGKTYELWFVRGDAPVSAGVFDVDGGDATALLSGDMQAGDAIAVTVEQAGGSPTGQPTSDPVIVIPTA
ncbi:Anti-sigma-K factor RskA [Microbacterium oxydans]|uniref:Anti-sigma-K factor RskA n=1 Tax=Microbacterium oxydans TaxID=82380 RepID=A0A0F0KYK8_9MICO|nr:anti-sigma factor [Microbacterium oxydans]KJL25953.1 Anti-sigma-K factor RskA [Microbacterium oxydans]